MRRRTISMLILAAVFASASCATLTTKVQSDPKADFSKYHTFRIAGSRMESGNIQWLQNQVASRLQAKGLREAGDQADLDVVTRLIRTPQEGSADSGYYAWWGGTTTSGMASAGTPSGTVVVDLVERARNQLVWRGEAQGTIPSTGSMREEKARLALDRLLAEYPPKPKTN